MKEARRRVYPKTTEVVDSWPPRWTWFLILGTPNEVGSWIDRVGLAKVDASLIKVNSRILLGSQITSYDSAKVLGHRALSQLTRRRW